MTKPSAFVWLSLEYGDYEPTHEAERAAAIAAIRRGIAAEKHRPFEEFAREQRRKYGLPRERSEADRVCPFDELHDRYLRIRASASASGAARHSRTVPSPLTEVSVLPSGEKPTVQINVRCPLSVATSSLAGTLHSFTVLSTLPV